LIGLLLAAAVCPGQDYVDQVVERARKEFEVPGIAVAIVKDGNVVLAKGYGVRKLGEPAPVTPHSLFRIASNTKAFTAAALAMLVDEGKLRWDDAVIQHMRDFQMYDPYVTRELTVRDLLVHRSGLGLGAGDLMFFPPSDLSREEIIRRLRFVKPATSFRSRYAYDNLLYLVAGQLIPAVTGESWDSFVKERIFTPLGMTSTNASTQALKAASDVAIPHSKASGKLEPLPHEDVDNNAPAGAINSCVADLAKWVTVQLNRGDTGKSRLFSEAQSKEMWSAQTVMPISAPAALTALGPNFSAYGLGWMLTCVSHGRPFGIRLACDHGPGLEAGNRGAHQPGSRRSFPSRYLHHSGPLPGSARDRLGGPISGPGKAGRNRRGGNREKIGRQTEHDLAALAAAGGLCRALSRCVVRGRGD
jgi:CubicO group peptidase (beta-lactamase class C family)